MALLRVGALPPEPLGAAKRFYEVVLPQIAPGDAALTLVFDPADHTHRAWRLAVAQGLARSWAPLRVNAVAGADEMAILAADTYLQDAPGVTGQYLPLAAAGGPT